jgi:photosystem I subunit 9
LAYLSRTRISFPIEIRGGSIMQDVKTYLSTAPVLATLWFGLLAGLLIEINRFFPDALVLPFI